ncbi:uncharacterized protein LOC103828827 [Brassica rapa]|uniref:uncharacterized protein LOC103828827 n=1 Tax=Brassica campestris TaxID=3711 RepID=UPI00142E1FE4|nr:uncharacterized protein LOC103828827 [Brassica rapa]
MLDRVLEGQQNLTVDFNGKIDSVYNNLNTKFETLSTNVKKLAMQVVRTGEAVKRQEALAMGVKDDAMKHHVNAITDDDFWQVVKHEKLQEGDFEQDTHIHPTLFMSTSIGKLSQPSINNERPPPINNLQYPSIDDYLSHSECSCQRSISHGSLHSGQNLQLTHQRPPVHIQKMHQSLCKLIRIRWGRILRKRKEEVAKNLKRGANEKKMDNFLKRFLRIPLEKPFEEVYFTHILWMFFRETKETEEDIRRMFHEARDKMKNRITLKKKSYPGKFAIPCLVKGIEFRHALCNTRASVSILPRVMADHLGLKVEPSKESFTFVDWSQRNCQRP